MFEKIKKWWDDNPSQRQPAAVLTIVLLIVVVGTFSTCVLAESHVMAGYTTSLSGKRTSGLMVQVCDTACLTFQREAGNDYLAVTADLSSDNDHMDSGWIVLQPGVALRNWRHPGGYVYAGAGGLTQDWGVELGLVGYDEYRGDHTMTRGVIGLRFRETETVRPVTFRREVVSPPTENPPTKGGEYE